MKKRDVNLYFFLLSLDDFSKDTLSDSSDIENEATNKRIYRNILEEIFSENNFEDIDDESDLEYYEQPFYPSDLLDEEDEDLESEGNLLFDELFYEALHDYAVTINRIENPKSFTEDCHPASKPA